MFRTLLISTTENGVQDHVSLLAAYEEFNSYLTQNNVQKPVVVLNDGHSSRFDVDLLEFAAREGIYIFLGPPDTTSITQLLDQVNAMLHSSYRLTKEQLFTSLSSINHEGFMEILANLWSEWKTKEKIQNAA